MSRLPWIVRVLLWFARLNGPPRLIPTRDGECYLTLHGSDLFAAGDTIETNKGPYVLQTRDGNTWRAKALYLARFFLTKRSRETEGMEEIDVLLSDERKPPRFGWYLHHFRRSDDGTALHSHPRRWAVSLVLSGGYSEERRIGYSGRPLARVERRTVRPWSLNFLRDDDFHRVDLLDENAGAWTLFLVGPLSQSWGFWDRVSGKFTAHDLNSAAPLTRGFSVPV